jgi:hypothetical protein
VTDNQKHFPLETFSPYGLECMTSDQYLEHQYHLDPDSFINILTKQATNIGGHFHN